MLFTEKLSKLGDQKVTSAVLDGAQLIQWYASDNSLWVRQGGGQRNFRNVPEEEIRAFMAKFPHFEIKERRKGQVPDRRIIDWTRT